jgi:hypothetical protein
LKRGECFTTGWIEEVLAVAGKKVRDKDTNEFWVVDKVYSVKMEEKEANIRSRDYTKQRDASDI